MAITNNFRQRDQESFIENPLDSGVDRRVNDSVTHNKLDTIAAALGTGSGSPVNTYSEISSLASSTLATIVTYIVPLSTMCFLQIVEASGTNIATYDLYLNGSKIDRKRSYFGNSLDVKFDFEVHGSRGLELNSGDTIEIKVTHERPFVGDFSGRIQVYNE